MVTDLGCNTVRIWGGGTYETDLFYEKCDELGIFVWQDFMMGCAIYPQDEYFQNKLKEEATYIVKHLRNHCSICLWAGDNENDLAAAFWSKGPFKPNDNVLTRKILPDVIKENDDTRPYLPSSPFIDKYCEKHLQEPLSEDHIWGPRDYFKGEFYNNAQCYFTSETGYQAMNSIESLNKYLKKPWPIFEEIVKKDDTSRLISDKSRMTKEYLCHATSDVDDYESPWSYRIPLIYNQVFALFTNEFDNLEDFVMASQISQAEALKHFIERIRRNYKRNGGIIWWNLLDGWPQPSDAVVDYYFSKKLAYYYIQRSQKDNLLMLYEEDGFLNLYCVSNDKKKHTLNYQIIDAYNDKVIDEGKVISKPRGSFMVKNVTADKKTLLVIKYKDEKGREYINHFHTNIIDIDLHKYIRGMRMYKMI